MINLLQKAAREAGEVLEKYFYQGVSASYKTSHKNLVTQADLESQQIIYKTLMTEMLKKGFKKNEIGFIGEENLNVQGKHKFIIDPIDGTSNFASGYTYACISIGYAENYQIKSGVIFNPLSDELYSAEIKKGSYKICGNKKIRLELKEKELKNSLVAVIFNKEEKLFSQEIDVYKKIFPHVRGIRINSSTALDLCKLAENIFPININGHSSIWDIAAANLIVSESGGQLYDWKGKKIFIDAKNPLKEYQFIACHPKLLQEILKFFD